MSKNDLEGRILVRNTNEEFKNTSEQPGLYLFHIKEGETIYIGMSMSDTPGNGIKGRLKCHTRIDPFNAYQNIDYHFFSYLLVDAGFAGALEDFLIRGIDPRANKNLKLPRESYIP